MTSFLTGTTWITYTKARPQALVRLFCFHHAGGTASTFRSWSDKLPNWIQVCPIQLPGRENRWNDNKYSRLLPLVEDLYDVLIPYLDMPFAFYGHSMGGLIAFELTRYLRKHTDKQPLNLFVSACPAPHIKQRRPELYKIIEDDGFLTELNNRYDSLSVKIRNNKELMQLVIPILRADFELCETYFCQPGTPLDCSFIIFGGIDDQSVVTKELEEWRIHTNQRFNLHLIPGKHLIFEVSEAYILNILKEELSKSFT